MKTLLTEWGYVIDATTYLFIASRNHYYSIFRYIQLGVDLSDYTDLDIFLRNIFMIRVGAWEMDMTPSV